MASVLLDFNNKLGDNIICNGLVREYCKKYERVGIFCIPRYKTSVSFMLRDLPNVELIMTKNHRRKQYYKFRHALRLTARHYGRVVELYNDPETGIKAERQFYAYAGVPHEKKWSSFHVGRDYGRERDFFNRVVPAQPYVFVHDDSAYGAPISLPMASLKNAPVVRADPGLTGNIFDYCSVIEKAAEIHAVDSVFMFLADCLSYDHPRQKRFVHRYARQNPPWNLPVLKKNWTIL